MAGWHDVAQICLNGHIVNDSVHQNPESNEAHCSKCGAPTITQCPKCERPIKGRHGNPRVITFGLEEPPQFCNNCGEPYPWTQSRINSAKEMVALLEGLSDSDRGLLAKSIDDIARDTPRTELAVTTTKSLLPKAGGALAKVFRDILVDVASAAAKKMLLGN